VIYKRGETWWYRIKWSGTDGDGKRQTFVIQRSAKTGNKNRARTIRDEHKHALRIGDVQPWEQWPKLKVKAKEVPILRDFSTRFLEYAEEHTKPGTHRFYSSCTENLLSFDVLANAKLDAINGELITAYTKRRKTAKASTIRVNGELRTLRRMLGLALEWQEIERKAVIHELPNEEKRDRVLTYKEEEQYLLHATDNLKDATILAVDTGLRPNSELFVLQWTDVHLEKTNGLPNGYIHVSSGKTKNAIRNVPLTPRARQVLLSRQKKAASEKGAKAQYVFPGDGNSGHIVSFQHPHEEAIAGANVKPFEFYCWRHTFGTRVAQSGVDKFALCRLMGHSSPSMTERYYVHVPESHVAEGFEKFDSFHSEKLHELAKGARIQ
jgi:integrase